MRRAGAAASLCRVWITVVAWWVGLLLQLVGIGIALWGILTNEDEYLPEGQRSVLRTMRELPGRAADRAKGAWRRLVYWVTGRRDVNIGAMAASMAVITSSVTATVTTTWPAPDPETPIEERVRIMEERLTLLHATVQTAQSNVVEAAENHAKLADEVTRQAEELRQHTAQEVGKLATKGVRWAAFGLLITAVGMVFSAFAQPPWL